MMALDARPRLRRAVRLRHDRARGRWLLLAPERGFVLGGSALEIVRALDGGTTLAALADRMAAAAGAPVAAEVVAFVRALAGRGLVEAAP